MIILFDGECNLCNNSVLFILRHEKNNFSMFASAQSKLGKIIFAKQKIDPQTVDSIILIDKGFVYDKSSAVLKIIKHLKFPWNLLIVFQILPRQLRDWIYDQIAKHRYSIWGKKKQCMIPAPDHQKRFISS